MLGMLSLLPQALQFLISFLSNYQFLFCHGLHFFSAKLTDSTPTPSYAYSMPVPMPWWSGRGLGWKIIIIYSNIGAELELISYRQDGIRPEMSHSSSRSHHCADVSISCLLPKTILYPAVPRLGSDPHLAYLMLSHHSSTLQRSGVLCYNDKSTQIFILLEIYYSFKIISSQCYFYISP